MCYWHLTVSYVLLFLSFFLKGFEFKGTTTEKCNLIIELWKAKPRVNPRMLWAVLLNQSLEWALIQGQASKQEGSNGELGQGHRGLGGQAADWHWEEQEKGKRNQ